MKTIRVCQECSCIENGAKEVVEQITKKTGLKLGEKNEKHDLDISSCLGCCSFGPSALVDGEIKLGEEIVKSI